MNEFNPRIIALYLPQYHPTPDNDKWWGKGFTEWTNVGKAKPLYRGHYQPRVPADLGYYDLRLPEIREEQVELAREAGIYGFCYYHYWFGYGKQELELPFNEVLKSGKPDFPFCLCWANESWYSKFWNKDGVASKRILVEQKYGDKQEWKMHFMALLPAFKDKRYIRINNKPLFMIYKEEEFAEVSEFIKYWNELARENGLDGICFIAHKFGNTSEAMVDSIISKGFYAVNNLGLWTSRSRYRTFLRKCWDKVSPYLFGVPNVCNYKYIYPYFVSEIDRRNDVFPTLIPNWDHSPRSGKNAYILTNSTPDLFAKHVRQILDIVNAKDTNEKIIFLKSWNEWGEGNYMEPDLKFGKGFIRALRNELEK